MAKIIGLEQQQEVMKYICNNVRDVVEMNKFLDTPNKSGRFTITFKDSEGKKVSSTILCSDKSVIDDLVVQYKKSVAEDLAAQAESNRIELDPEEKAILGL